MKETEKTSPLFVRFYPGHQSWKQLSRKLPLGYVSVRLVYDANGHIRPSANKRPLMRWRRRFFWRPNHNDLKWKEKEIHYANWTQTKTSKEGKHLRLSNPLIMGKISGKFPEKSKHLSRTVFENYSKCRILIFEFWHFPPIFVLLKLTCLVTLFDRKLHVFKNSPKWKWTSFGIFNELLSTQ